MTTVILCDRLQPLKGVLKSFSGPLRYLSFMENQEWRAIRDYLRGMAGGEELSRSRLLLEGGQDFRQKYIEFMGRLNFENHSPLWWAMPFTSKNPLATSLCRNVAYFLLAARLAKSSGTPLLLVTDAPDLAAQVEAWGHGEGIKVLNLVKARRTWRGLVRSHNPGAVLYAIARTLWISLLTRGSRPRYSSREKHTVVASLLHARSLATGHYQDVYFGSLVDSLADGGNKVLVLVLLQERWRRLLRELSSVRQGTLVVPAEAYLSLGDLARCGVQALGAYFSPPTFRGGAEIDGYDMGLLVKRAIRSAKSSGSFLLNLRVLYSARRLARDLQIDRCFYPYENRSWEKMLNIGVKRASPATRMVGYQHASITLSHTNFALGCQESGIIPLPDVIMTTGPIVRDRLEREGNYPQGVLKVGCALRQDPVIRDGARARRGRVTHILMALSTSLEEYTGCLTFLEEALAGQEGYQLRIRPHPAIPIQPALEIAPLGSHDFFATSSGPLAEDLEWADVVLYASSTVGMEAVSQGIPSIYLDLGNFLDTDPMLGWDEFKWSAREPADLLGAIHTIEGLSDGRYEELQEKGYQYLDSYLSPVTPEGLRSFTEV